MYAVETLIERLQEQIELAPKLQESTVPGGRTLSWVPGPPEADNGTLTNWLVEAINTAHNIELLRPVEGGPRRYRRHIEKALEHCRKLIPIFQQVGAAKGAAYESGADREKSLGRFAAKDKSGLDTAGQIAAACKAAIGELEGALKILEEGERKEARLAGAGK